MPAVAISGAEARAPVVRRRTVPALPVVDRDPPPLQLTMPSGTRIEMPGGLWPELALKQALDRGRAGGYVTGVRAITKAQASEYLIAWEHPLHLPDDDYPDGRPFMRPFGYQAWLFEVFGEPAALVMSGSYVNRNIGAPEPYSDLHRYNTVELTRIARSPQHRHENCLRMALRWWREYGCPLWEAAYWPVQAAVTLSIPSRSGNLYRADGFRKVRSRPPARGGGGGWQKRSLVAAIATDPDHEMGLWIHRFPRPLSDATAVTDPVAQPAGAQLDIAIAA